MKAKRTFTREFKLNAIRPILAGEKRLSQTCRELDLCESVLGRWITQYQAHGENAFTDEARRDFVAPTDERVRIQQLEAALGRAHLEIEFLKDVLSKKGSTPGRGSK